MTDMTTKERLAESSTLAVLARLSMLATPILIGLVVWFASEWANSVEANAAAQRIEIERTKQETTEMRERMKVVENNQVRGREDREEFQRQTTAQLNQILSQMSLLSSGFAALTATVNAQQKQIDRQR